MTEPLISVITPTFKRCSTGELDRCIRSVGEQLDDRWKHYIVGDNCPELERYKKKLEKSDACVAGKRVVINLPENSNDLGVTPLNHALGLVTTPYFCILADDNLWLPHHLAALLEFMVRNEGLYGFAYGNQIIKHKRIPEYYRIRVSSHPAWNHIDLGDPIYRKELWDKYGPFKYEDRPDIGDVRADGGKYSYDWHFLYDCLKGGTKWVHMNFDPSLIWYLDDKSGTKSTNWNHDRLRIGALPAGDGGCAWYRLKYPLNAIAKMNGAHVTYAPPHLTEYGLETWFQNQEVIVFQGVASLETAALIDRLKNANKACVTDVDDYIAAIDYDNTSYNRMGTKNVTFRFKDKDACLKHLNMWLSMAKNEDAETRFLEEQIKRVTESEYAEHDLHIHRHGYNGFDIERNLRSISAANTCYRMVDGIQVTTKYMAEKMREHNDNVFIFPNCLDFKLWDSSLKFERTDKKIRIVWSGGSSHLEDLMLCRDALADVLVRHPECVFVCAGFTPEGFSRVFDSKQVETVPWCDFKEHPYRLHRLRPDIGIIPLRDSLFANCKSPIKWVELSALGVPCVVSNSVVYNTEIKNGETGFLFDTQEQFTLQLETLIRDANTRMEMGDRAEAYVKKHFDIADWAPRLLKWYEVMWLKKNIKQPELNTLTPVLKEKWESILGHPINSIKALDGAV